MSREDATAPLTDGLGDRPTEAVDVVADDSTAEFDPEAAGMGVDVEATVDAAVGFSLDPRVVR